MPSAWMLGPLIIKSSLVILVVSFILGIIFFRFISPFTKEETKKRIDEVVSFLIGFVIALWIAKIMLNLPAFISDPRAMLAYPSDSNAFYLAFVIMIIYTRIRVVKDYQHLITLQFTFITIFISATFIYEFVQIISGNLMQSPLQLAIHLIMLGFIVVYVNKKKLGLIVFVSILGWSLGMWILSLFTTTTIFQFSTEPVFYLIICIVSVIVVYFRQRKQA